ncbi:hypothetical protein LAZ67_20000744 [Cordylochernes scorpioides]|uniref:Uncharacterized protein n=1 Tax=Cordylochernes scorpioides TaxID=51811 RepID=A0ABY6LJG6_9ARAC|nr:hypothetical protein LAZ67_20000744 [Cordylochernes scorpioides]
MPAAPEHILACIRCTKQDLWERPLLIIKQLEEHELMEFVSQLTQCRQLMAAQAYHLRRTVPHLASLSVHLSLQAQAFLVLLQDFQELGPSSVPFEWVFMPKYASDDNGKVTVECHGRSYDYGHEYGPPWADWVWTAGCTRVAISLLSALSSTQGWAGLCGDPGSTRSHLVAQLAQIQVLGRACYTFPCSPDISWDILRPWILGSLLGNSWLTLDNFHLLEIEEGISYPRPQTSSPLTPATIVAESTPSRRYPLRERRPPYRYSLIDVRVELFKRRKKKRIEALLKRGHVESYSECTPPPPPILNEINPGRSPESQICKQRLTYFRHVIGANALEKIM